MMRDQHYSELQAALEERAASYVKKIAEAYYDPLDELTAKALQLSLLDGIEDYEIQGRRFAGLIVEKLKHAWVIALRGVLDGDASMLENLDDAMAELLLRGVEPPYDSVQRARRTKLRPHPFAGCLRGINNHGQTYWLA